MAPLWGGAAHRATEDTMPHINVHDLGRLTEIAKVLVRNGFGQLVQGMPIELPSEIEASGLPTAARIRKTLTELGPTFVKLGQVLSVRPDIVSASLMLELQSLQDRVPPIGFAAVKEVLEQELGTELGDLFQSIEETPLASASIAQVHRAVLRDGQTVAVKVQRPEIAERIRSDLHILYTLAHFIAGRIELPGFYTPVGIVKEFDAAINMELDFLQEGRAIARFRHLFRNHEEITAPEVFKELSTRRVLVMELMEGRPLSELDPEDQEEAEAVMDKVIEATYCQVFEFGFFHGDPHPGNLMCMDDGRLAYLDFGMTGTLTGEMQDTLMSLFVALVYKDADAVALTLYRAGATKERVDLKGFKREIEKLIVKYHGATLETLADKGSLMDFVQVASQFKIRLVTEYAVLARAMSLLDGVARRFIPHVDLVAKVGPYAQRLFGKRLGPERLSRDAVRLMQQAQVAVRDVPMQVSQLVMDLQTGAIEVGFRDREAAQMRAEIRWAGFRISLALVAAGTALTGAVLMAPLAQELTFRDVPPLPIVGIILMASAAALVLGLVTHTFFAARIHPREWLRRGLAVVRFFLPGGRE
jgi:ubiquinone biosynthesis protein